MDLVNIFIRSAFVDNMIFAFFFGMCSYLAVSKTVKTAVGLGFAVIFVLTVTIPINYLIENYVLKEGALTWMGDEYASVNLNYLTFIMFIAVIASTVQLVEMIVEKISPALYRPRYFLTSYCGKLCYFRWCIIYAGKTVC